MQSKRIHSIIEEKLFDVLSVSSNQRNLGFSYEIRKFVADKIGWLEDEILHCSCNECDDGFIFSNDKKEEKCKFSCTSKLLHKNKHFNWTDYKYCTSCGYKSSSFEESCSPLNKYSLNFVPDAYYLNFNNYIIYLFEIVVTSDVYKNNKLDKISSLEEDLDAFGNFEVELFRIDKDENVSYINKYIATKSLDIGKLDIIKDIKNGKFDELCLYSKKDRNWSNIICYPKMKENKL